MGYTKQIKILNISGLVLILPFIQFVFGQSAIPIIPLSKFNYNQPCVIASQCNNNAGLYCIPTTPSGQQLRCGCPTNNTIFDEYQGRCVGKVGHPCIYQGNNSFCPEKAHCSHTDPHHPDLYYYEPRCFCDGNYFANKDGKCILAAKFGEPCSSSSKKCDEVSGLKCIGGKCTCQLGIEDQYFDSKKDKCVSYLGKKCTGYYSCIENARCEGNPIQRARVISNSDKDTSSKGNRNTGSGIGGSLPAFNAGKKGINDIANSDRKVSLPGSESTLGKCVCEYGFTPTKDGKCLGGYRQTCSDVQICNSADDLECLDGSCNCKSPLHQQYDQAKRKCMSLTGAKCSTSENTNGGGLSCIDNAECLNGICKCNAGFSSTPFRRCMLDYQKSCENGHCNMYNGLTCKSKKCSCVDHSLVYNIEAQACVSQEGSPCGRINQAGDYGKEFFYISCEPGTFCKQEPGGDSSTSFCRRINEQQKDSGAVLTR